MSLGTATFHQALKRFKLHGPESHSYFAGFWGNRIEFVDLWSDGLNESGRDVSIPQNCIPLVAAILAGFNDDILGKIVLSHGITDALPALVSGLSEYLVPISMGDGESITPYALLTKCMQAIESVDEKALETAFQDQNDPLVTILLLNSKNPKHWPSEILRQREAEQGSPENLHSLFVKTNIFDMLKENAYPHDESGIRFDWLIERSGMLVPGVVRKSLGRYSLWEGMCLYGSIDTDIEVRQGLIDYCRDRAPLEQRDAIKWAMSSMIFNITSKLDAWRMLDWMRDRFKDTYLADVPDSTVLQINMVNQAADWKSGDMSRAKAAYHVAVHQEGIAQRLFDEIMQVPVDHMGLAQFKALSFLRNERSILPPQRVRDGFDREKLICHLMAGLESFCAPKGARSAYQNEALEAVEHGISAGVTCLAGLGDFDYKRLGGVGSNGAKILAMAGLDIRRLPRMSPRDRGRVLEQDLGM
jgi:hypothetical protein